MEKWKELQTDLINHLEADKANKNPSRVFRLAGYYHVKKGSEPVMCELINVTDNRYSYDDLRVIIPTEKNLQNKLNDGGRMNNSTNTNPKKETAPNYKSWDDFLNNSTFPYSVELDLIELLPKGHQDNINRGVTEGNRDNIGIALARELKAIVSFLNCNNQSYTGSIDDVLTTYARNCNPSLSSRDVERWLKSSNNYNDNTCLDEAQIKSKFCSKIWKEKKVKKAKTESKTTTAKTESKEKKGFGDNFRMLSNELRGRLVLIISKQLDEPSTKLLVNDLINESLWSPNEVWKIYYDLQEKENFKEDAKLANKQFLKLKKFNNEGIKLEEIFPAEVANALNTKATSDRIDPVRILQNLLPAVASLMGSKLGIVVKKGATEFDSWIEYPVFWTADIAPPSSGKSNAQRPCWQPIKALQAKEDMRIKEALAELKQVEADWKNRSKSEREDLKNTDANPVIFKRENCTPQKFIFDKGQIEAILRRLSEQSPLQGTAWVSDELSGLFSGLDQYKSSKKGDSIQILLESWNGKMYMGIDRVDIEQSFSLRGQTLNLCGGIQPDKAQEIWKTNDDPDGLLSRMLPAISKIPDDFCKWSDTIVNVHTMLSKFYDAILTLNEGLVYFSTDAHSVYKNHYELLSRGYLEYLTSNPAYAYFLGKQKTYVPRLALVLHTIDYLCGQAEDLHECSLSALNRAIKLSNFYCQQFRLLQTDARDQESLDGLALKVYQMLQNQNTLTTRQIQQRFSRVKYLGKPVNASVVSEIMATLADNGIAKLEGKTITLIEEKPVIKSPEIVTEVIENVEFISSPEVKEVPQVQSNDDELIECFESIKSSKDLPLLNQFSLFSITEVLLKIEKTDNNLYEYLILNCDILSYLGGRE